MNDSVLIEINMIDKVTQPLTGVVDQINQIVQTASSDFDKVKSSASDVVQTFTEMGTSLEPILTMDWEVGGADSLENVGRILEHVSTASSEILSLGLGSQLVQVFKDAEGGINKFADSLDQGIDNVVETFDLAKTKAKDFSNTAKAQFAALSQRTQNYIQIGKRLTTSFSANGVKGFASAVKQQFAGISQQTQSLIGRIKNVGTVFSTGGFKNGAKNFAKSVNLQLTSISQKAAGLSGMGGRAQQFLGPISSSLDNVKNSLSQGMGEGIAKVTALGEKFPFLSGGTELVAAGMTSLDGVMKSASGTISGVQSAITLVSDSAGVFQSVMGSASTVITTFQGVMGAMSNVMAVFGRLIPSVSTAMMVMTSPVTWIVLGIVALIAAVYLIIKYWDDLVAAMSKIEIFQQIGHLFGWLSDMWGQFVSYLSGTSFGAIFGKIFNQIKGYVDKIIGMFKSIGSGISWIAGKLGLSFGSDDAKKPEQGMSTETRAAEKLQKQAQPVAQASKSEKRVLTEARTTENIQKQVQPVTRASKSEKRVLTEAHTTENIRKQVQPVTRASKSEKRVLTEARTTENIQKQVRPVTRTSESATAHSSENVVIAYKQKQNTLPAGMVQNMTTTQSQQVSDVKRFGDVYITAPNGLTPDQLAEWDELNVG
ncbi:hypothetical protein BSQ33_17710 [Vibrio gazogenes]|uniref:Phage tail tape measure protein n=2 Tax=Vibrio gazogenes TaxID=687 RepID=A0A1Z2SK84_VIBGA|nr:hypothetical protein BSQ33_17710 [Vibrio gazogenes]